VEEEESRERKSSESLGRRRVRELRWRLLPSKVW